jgi:hypothetical protein
MTVSIQGSKHFKSVAIVDVTLVFEEETKDAIFHGKSELAFPETATFEIQQGGDKLAIGATSRDLRLPKVELVDAAHIDVGLYILDWVDLEILHCRR